MIKTHVIRLYPTFKQEVLFKKSCGVARHSYNWALSKWQELHKLGDKPSAYSLIKLQNSIKRSEMPFYMEVSKTAPQYAIHNLEKAYKSMWKLGTKYPKFKKKGVRDSFVAVENKEAYWQKDYRIHIPKVGKVKCAENLRFVGRVNSVKVKRISDKWFAIINVETSETDMSVNNENQVVIGVDAGIKSMFVTSDGSVYNNPRSLRVNLKKLRRANKSLARKKKDSNNREKAKIKLSKLHYRISCVRSHALHCATTSIVNKADKIVIEGLSVANMIKNRSLSLALSDVGIAEGFRQIKYKAEWQGKEVIIADRFFPSSKLCSMCGNKKKDLKLSERMYNCDACGFSIDRDLNAAINLANYSPTVKTTGSQACGDGSSVSSLTQPVDEARIKN